ncbi:M24 family metallopeptidase [Chitinimonas koreensis]|uniref:M24 family metallopeptidase n=1 Tax=Chitinimonas koreensis TaxID=356302 RepID=UPI000420C30A|nr:M24 family metallopeptidase [Chitinimonas koreensis]QNM95719.1 aminopeptidase P family protein [Chitinimonas koreensis]
MAFTPEELQQLQDLVDERVEARRAPFSGEEYRARLARLRAAMTAAGVDLVLLSSPESQCWLHGYQARWYRTGSSTAWPPVNFTAVHRDHDRLIVFDTQDHAHLIAFTSIATDLRHPAGGDPDLDGAHAYVLEALAAETPSWLSGTVGIEKWSPRQNAATTDNLATQLQRRDLAVRDVSVMLRALQSIKSDEEIALIRAASLILDRAYARLEQVLKPGMTERQVWALMETYMADEGGETSALHNTVSRTRNYCHALSGDRPIGQGQLLLDPCAVLHRYHANTARQFFLGKAVPDALQRASSVAAGALEVLLEFGKVGAAFSKVSDELQRYYEREGLWGIRDWIGGYQLGIAFPPDWVGEFTWSVEEDSADTRIIEHGLVTNFESFVGGAGFIDTIVFLDEARGGTQVLSGRQRVICLIDNE